MHSFHEFERMVERMYAYADKYPVIYLGCVVVLIILYLISRKKGDDFNG